MSRKTTKPAKPTRATKADPKPPTFRCPVCGGDATLLPDDDGGELQFLCLDCPAPIELPDPAAVLDAGR